MRPLLSYREILERIRDERAVLLYLSFPGCGVCASIRPKVIDLVEANFPRLGMYDVDLDAVPDARGQLSAFAVPVVIVYFEGKEMVREARNFGIKELGAKIDRYYSMLFD